MAQQREPCPYRIQDDAGGSFAIGLTGGTAWYGLKGARNAPRGALLAGARSGILLNVPGMAASFGVWGLAFSTGECALKWARGREDPFNGIGAGFISGMVLSARANRFAPLFVGGERSWAERAE